MLKALSHEESDRIPIDFGGPMTTAEAEGYEHLREYLDIEDTTQVFGRTHVKPHKALLKKFNVDTRYIYFTPPVQWIPPEAVNRTHVDEWGVTRRMAKGSYYYDLVDSPLQDATVDDLKLYSWPTEIPKESVLRWAEEARHLSKRGDVAVVADAIGLGIFEQAWYLRGFQKFLIDLHRDPVFVEALLDKVLETQIKRFGAYLGAVGPYIDVIVVGDDLAMQTGPLIDPKMYRQIIKPRHRELFKYIKNKTKARLFLHSCGAVIDFISDFIDMGVDILNPIQVTAKGMEDTARLKKTFGKDIVFWGGGCDTQHILPEGSPEDVRNEVKKRINDLAPGGGFVFAAVHNIQPDVPPENIVAMYKAAQEFGSSPLRGAYT